MPSSEEKKTDHSILISDMQIRELSKTKDLNPSYVPKGGQVTRINGQNIVTVDMPKEQTISQFEPGKIHDTRGIKYSNVSKGIADSSVKKNARFRVSELTRGPLSVEAEEEERIETEVQRRLAVRIEELRAQTTTDAYHEGFNLGKTDGHAEVLTQSGPKLKAFESLLASFEGMKGEIFKANEEFFVHMVQKLTKTVILRELKDDTGYTRRLALHILDRLGTRENIKIFIGAEEQSSVEALKDGLAQTLGQLKNVAIEVDPSIKIGGCRVETEFGEVDGRIEVQLQSIANGLGIG